MAASCDRFKLLNKYVEECKKDGTLLPKLCPLLCNLFCSEQIGKNKKASAETATQIWSLFIPKATARWRATKGLVIDHVLEMHIMFPFLFRLLSQPGCCPEKFVSKLTETMLTWWNNADYLWLLVEVVHDLTDSLYALYHFDIMLQIQAKQNKKELKSKQPAVAADSESVHLLALQRWFTIIYHLYHTLKSHKCEHSVLHNEYWKHVGSELIDYLECCSFDLESDEFDSTIGLHIALNNSNVHFIRCNLMEMISRIYGRISQSLPPEITMKMEWIITRHLSYAPNVELERALYSDPFSLKLNRIRSKSILPTRYLSYLSIKRRGSKAMDICLDDNDSAIADDSCFDSFDSSTEDEVDGEDHDGQFSINPMDIEINSEVIQRTLYLVNILLRFGNDAFCIAGPLKKLVDLLSKSMFLRSRPFDDELSVLLYAVSTKLECVHFRRSNHIQSGKGFIPNVLSLIPILLANSSSSSLKCSIGLFISKLLHVFPSQTLPFIKLLATLMDTEFPSNDPRETHQIISCSIYQITIGSLSAKQRNCLLSSDIVECPSFDAFREKHYNKRNGPIKSHLFIMEALWPFLHSIVVKATAAPDKLLSMVNEQDSVSPKKGQRLTLTSDSEKELESIANHLDVSLRVFCSVIPTHSDHEKEEDLKGHGDGTEERQTTRNSLGANDNQSVVFSLVSNMGKLIDCLLTLHSMQNENASSCSVDTALRPLIEVDKRWLIGIINVVLQSIAFCLEHQYLRPQQLPFCQNGKVMQLISNLLQHDKKLYVEGDELMYCDIMVLISHLDLQDHRKAILYPMMSSILNPRSSTPSLSLKIRTLQMIPLLFSRYSGGSTRVEVCNYIVQLIRNLVQRVLKGQNSGDRREIMRLLRECSQCASRLICILGHDHSTSNNHFYRSPHCTKILRMLRVQKRDYCTPTECILKQRSFIEEQVSWNQQLFEQNVLRQFMSSKHISLIVAQGHYDCASVEVRFAFLKSAVLNRNVDEQPPTLIDPCRGTVTECLVAKNEGMKLNIDRLLLHFECPSCDFIMARQRVLHQKKNRQNQVKLLADVIEKKKDLQCSKAIFGCKECEDEFTKECPMMNRTVIDAAFLKQYEAMYRAMWAVAQLDDAAQSKAEGGGDEKVGVGVALKVQDHSCIALGKQLTVDIFKLVAHASCKVMEDTETRHRLKTWIVELVLHPIADIMKTATQNIYLLMYHFFVVAEFSKPDALTSMFCPIKLLKKHVRETKRPHYPMGVHTEDQKVSHQKKARSAIIGPTVFELDQETKKHKMLICRAEKAEIYASIVCMLEPESDLSFVLLQQLLLQLVSTPLASYQMLQRIVHLVPCKSFGSISLLLQSFTDRMVTSKQVASFRDFMVQTLKKSEKHIDVIASDLLKIDGKSMFREMLPTIFPKLVFDRKLEEIEAISSYLGVSAADIASDLLHKILPRVLIEQQINSDDESGDMLHWMVTELFGKEKKAMDLLMAAPSMLVNELILICGSGFPNLSRDRLNEVRDGAEKALLILAMAYRKKDKDKRKKKRKKSKRRSKRHKAQGTGDSAQSDLDSDPQLEDDEVRAEMLAQYSSEILLGFSQKLNPKNGDEDIIASNKRKTMRSLRAMIRMLGSKLPQFASKMIGLLKMGLSDSALMSQTLNVWKDFFEHLPGTHLARNFAQIVVTLLHFLELPKEVEFSSSTSPLEDLDEMMENESYFALTQGPLISSLDQQMASNRGLHFGGAMDIDADGGGSGGLMMGALTQSMPMSALTQMPMPSNTNTKTLETANNAQIVCLLQQIIIEQRDFTESRYHQIPMLPDVPCLKEISDAIRHTLGNQSLDSKLTHITSMLSNESVSIKKMALNTLLYTMQKQREKMELVILSDVRYDPLLNNMIHCLLPMSTSNDEEIIKLCARCLGELGAIDFVALHNSQHEKASVTSKEVRRDDEKEIIELDADEEDSDLEIVGVRKPGKSKKVNRSESGKAEGEEKEGEDSNGKLPEFIANINDLALHIVREYLIPIHRSSHNSNTQNQAQYALQELLKVLECTLKTPDDANRCKSKRKRSRSLAVSNWMSFSEDMQELLSPCLRDTFSIQSDPSTANGKDAAVPKHGDNAGTNNNDKSRDSKRAEPSVFTKLLRQQQTVKLDQWMFKLCKLFVSYVEEMYSEIQAQCQFASSLEGKRRGSPRGREQRSLSSKEDLERCKRNEKRLQTFKACFCVKNHIGLSSYLLPFLVHELLQRPKSIHLVIAQFEDVFLSKAMSSNAEIQQCVHRIFYVVDVLMNWQSKIVSDAQAFSRPNSQNAGIKLECRERMLASQALFDELPFLDLSNAAYCCNSFGRAIKYFEMYTFKLLKDAHSHSRRRRNTKSVPKALQHLKRNDNDGKTLPLSLISAGQLPIEDIDFWQKVQSGTKDRDELVGVSIFRMKTNTLQQALDLESNGKWDRAAGIYEQILQCNPNDIEVHEKYLKCLLRLGHFSAIIAHVNGVQHIDVISDDDEDVTMRNQNKALTTLTDMTTNDLSTNIVPPPQITAVSRGQDSLASMDDLEAYSAHFNLHQNGKGDDKDALNSHDFAQQLVSFGIESSWKLQRWELLDKFLTKCPVSKLQNSFPCRLGECLSILRSNKGFIDAALTDKFEKAVDSARMIVMKDISSCHMEGYQIVYPHLVRLHMLQELTHFQKSYMLCDHEIAIFPDGEESGNLYGHKPIMKTSDDQAQEYMNRNNSFFWNQRLNRTSNMLSVREPVLSLRRVLYSLQHLKQEEAFCWLKLAKEARAHQQLSHADTALVYAEMISMRLAAPYIKWQTFLEKIQLTYNQGEIYQSLMKTQKVLSETSTQKEIPSRISSKMHVLLAGWMNETNSYESQEIVAKYRKAITIRSKDEEPYFKLATFLDDKLLARHCQSAMEHVKCIKDQNELHKTSLIASVGKSKLFLSVNNMDIPIQIALHRKYNLVNMLHDILENYTNSLMNGHKHLFRSLPRLFTLWCDNGKVLALLSRLKYGEDIALSNRSRSGSLYSKRSPRSSSNNNRQSATDRKLLDALKWRGTRYPQFINEWAQNLPEYQYMCIMPIITARITHEKPHITEFITTVLTRCLVKYPPQLLWHIALLINYNHLESSNSNSRKQQCAKVMESLQHYIQSRQFRDKWPNRGRAVSSLLEQMTNVLGSLIKLVPPESRTSNGGRRSSVKKVKFPSYLANPRLTDGFLIVVPTQRNLEPSLPAHNDSTVQCYSADPITIHRFCKEFQEMSSAAKPKKIDVIGSDGMTYSFLVKRENRGDMRKDSRLMEICGVINRLLHGNIESRNRKLNVHNYSVICITERVGVIEWVGHTNTLRNILTETFNFDKLLKSEEEGFSKQTVNCSMKDITAELREILKMKQEKFRKKEINSDDLAAFFESRILGEAPVVLHKYFERNWINCNEWYNARLLYTRSAAVWSMIGYIVALGDRHLENILINVQSGECIHVDFDCLFDKAKGFAYPEQVSFRLTRNIIDGFGVVGVEGVFRKAAECALDIFKQNEQTLMQSISSFIHDPLIERTSQQKNSRKEAMQRQASKIRRRLRDCVPSLEFDHENPMLSPELDYTKRFSTIGQVQQLIQQCSNKKLLSKMFVGWMPFI